MTPPTPLRLRFTLYALATFATLLGPATLRAAHDLRLDPQAPTAVTMSSQHVMSTQRRLPNSVHDLPPERVIDRSLHPASASQVIPSISAARRSTSGALIIQSAAPPILTTSDAANRSPVIPQAAD